MKKISKILFDSVEKRVQSFQKLCEVIKNKKTGRYKIDKYCAIGAIGCENKLIKLSKARYNYEEFHLEKEYEFDILIKAGIPKTTVQQDYRNFISSDAIQAIAKKEPITLRSPLPLHTLIMALNDRCKWTFKQIGIEMQLLEGKHAIVYTGKK